MTVSQWLDIWYETYSLGWEVTTRNLGKETIKDHIKNPAGQSKLSDLARTTYVRAYINKLLEDYKLMSVETSQHIKNNSLGGAKIRAK